MIETNSARAYSYNAEVTVRQQCVYEGPTEETYGKSTQGREC